MIANGNAPLFTMLQSAYSRSMRFSGMSYCAELLTSYSTPRIWSDQLAAELRDFQQGEHRSTVAIPYPYTITGKITSSDGNPTPEGMRVIWIRPVSRGIPDIGKESLNLRFGDDSDYSASATLRMQRAARWTALVMSVRGHCAAAGSEAAREGCHAGPPSSHWLSVSCSTLVPS